MWINTLKKKKELNFDHSTVIQNLKQVGRVKNSISGYLMSWPKKKKIIFKCDLLFFYAQQWTISPLDCDMWQKVDFIVQPEMTSSVTGLRRNAKTLPIAKLASEKGHGHWWLQLIWSTAAFWILVKPLHLKSMLSKSMRFTENCKTWSWDWSIEWAQFFSTTTPDCILHNQCLKSWMNWASKFCLLYHMHQTWDQLTTTSSILTTFYRENASMTSRMQKKLFPRVRESRSTNFYTTRTNKLISCWLKCTDCNGSYFD